MHKSFCQQMSYSKQSNGSSYPYYYVATSAKELRNLNTFKLLVHAVKAISTVHDKVFSFTQKRPAAGTGGRKISKPSQATAAVACTVLLALCTVFSFAAAGPNLASPLLWCWHWLASRGASHFWSGISFTIHIIIKQSKGLERNFIWFL